MYCFAIHASYKLRKVNIIKDVCKKLTPHQPRPAHVEFTNGGSGTDGEIYFISQWGRMIAKTISYVLTSQMRGPGFQERSGPATGSARRCRGSGPARFGPGPARSRPGSVLAQLCPLTRPSHRSGQVARSARPSAASYTNPKSSQAIRLIFYDFGPYGLGTFTQNRKKFLGHKARNH